MMKKLPNILALGLLLTSYQIMAQCNTCTENKGFDADYCYVRLEYPGLCAQFSEKQKKFILSDGKKSKYIKSTGDYTGDYLRGLAREKSYKLTAEQMLFLVDATRAWTVERRKFGHTYTESGLGYKIMEEGSGKSPKSGKPVSVHYIGYLEDGTEFDSSYKRNAPFTFTLGEGQVIKGWDEGVALLKKGSKAILRIPPDLAYGSMQRGPIPANATLYFVIELIED